MRLASSYESEAQLQLATRRLKGRYYRDTLMQSEHTERNIGMTPTMTPRVGLHGSGGKDFNPPLRVETGAKAAEKNAPEKALKSFQRESQDLTSLRLRGTVYQPKLARPDERSHDPTTIRTRELEPEFDTIYEGSV